MPTINDLLLAPLLQKDFETFFKIIADRKLEFEGNLLFRVETHQDESPDSSSDGSAEITGFYIRIDITQLLNLAKMVIGFQRSNAPITILGIVSKDGKEKYQPLG